MEIEYNVKLYYRIERLEDVLLKLPTLADPIEGALCTIALPNDRCVHVPFTSGEQNRLINFQYTRGANFDTRLMFEIDDPLLDYMQLAESTAKIYRQSRHYNYKDREFRHRWYLVRRLYQINTDRRYT
jgi:hypothetical protein